MSTDPATSATDPPLPPDSPSDAPAASLPAIDEPSAVPAVAAGQGPPPNRGWHAGWPRPREQLGGTGPLAGAWLPMPWAASFTFPWAPERDLDQTRPGGHPDPAERQPGPDAELPGFDPKHLDANQARLMSVLDLCQVCGGPRGTRVFVPAGQDDLADARSVSSPARPRCSTP